MMNVQVFSQPANPTMVKVNQTNDSLIVEFKSLCNDPLHNDLNSPHLDLSWFIDKDKITVYFDNFD
jgi:hypothetical protein